MADVTGIKWTDSTANPWWGCTKVEGAFACVGCYAEEVDKRGTAADQPLHWGHGAPRRRVSEKARNEPLRWQKGADKFFAEHGRNRRVFTLSMGDIFDKEVDDAWRAEHVDRVAAARVEGARVEREAWQAKREESEGTFGRIAAALGLPRQATQAEIEAAVMRARGAGGAG